MEMKSYVVLNEEQKMLQEAVSKFVEREVVPNYSKWYWEDRQVDHALYRKLGEAGFLCPWAEEKYGGSNKGFLESYVIANELARRGMGGVQTWLHSDVVAPYIAEYGSEDLKDRFMPDIVKGNKVLAIAMTEPDAGSDLGAIRTTAVKDGDDYVINGNKIFISNGYTADLIVTAVKTDPAAGAKGMSLVVIDTTVTAGITRRKLNKMGGHIMDTAEIFFDNVRIPQSNLIGKEGRGFAMLMAGLQQERVLASMMAIASCEVAMAEAIKYAKQRKIFGSTVAKFQNTQFRLAELAGKIMAGRALVDNLVMAHADKQNVSLEVAAAKMYTTELIKEAVDIGVQIHGGYGYMMEYPIARMYLDGRVSSITAGTTEVMKLIIGRELFAE